MATSKVVAQAAIANITGMKNSELFAWSQRINPEFASHTGKKTYDQLQKSGYSDFNYSEKRFINDWYNVIVMPVLQLINISHARDRFLDAGFGEVYDTPFGGIVQRMSTNSVKPMSPAYKGLKDGASVDQQIVLQPTISQRFFTQNFDYQSGITISEKDIKPILASEYGMGELVAGHMQGLENGYIIQRYLNKLEVINAGINGLAGEDGIAHTLRDTQKLTVDSWTDAAPTDEDLLSFVANVQDLITAFEITPQTGDFNCNGFQDVQDISRLKILVRAGIKKKIMRQLIRTSYHDEVLALPEMIEVPHFGGLEAYKEAGFVTKLYPVYDELGRELGYSEQQGQTGIENVTVTNDKVFWKDPNEKVLAVVADKGWIFENIQNPYTVQPAPFNARGMYITYWGNCPNAAIHYDSNYNMVVISKP